MNLYIKQKQTHRHRQQIYGYQRGKWVGINQEIEINIYTLLHLKQITNKDLQYSTGYYTHYYIRIIIFKKICMYVYTTESLCCTPETNTKL